MIDVTSGINFPTEILVLKVKSVFPRDPSCSWNGPFTFLDLLTSVSMGFR